MEKTGLPTTKRAIARASKFQNGEDVDVLRSPEQSNIELSKHLFSYKNVVKDNQIDLILYVASAEERPDLKLFKALQKAKLDSKDEKARSKLK